LVEDAGLITDDDYPDEVYFWYHPESNAVLQSEYLPGQINGLYRTEGSARTFMSWEFFPSHGDEFDSEELELYKAEVELLGTADEQELLEGK